jgi:tetratricopeptide (TPR) repeat protein
LGDKQGAIPAATPEGYADYTQALRINPNLAPPYASRGIARLELGDKQGAIANLQKAADLNSEQGIINNYWS